MFFVSFSTTIFVLRGGLRLRSLVGLQLRPLLSLLYRLVLLGLERGDIERRGLEDEREAFRPWSE